ncbi:MULTISPECIES: hypothetical protein [Micromonospora]|uniref:Metal-dependent enzyme (Double-stranded beta helix superfamily) n=1 Tax=Micromonospora vinacea TaxID=709878 RepID=A0ABS0K8S7_9ACTN|nr:hypothetical protein [Micromonospora vinacea]MBG6105037.1 putative metal-dependent enzyme (double-stranded beta helix superfamily) [Micromonospora vinacea]WSZ78776.1 hypothetical protein OH804_09925 [Micromonospora sp. NBC_00860]WTA64794.1 hypothetical protein OHB51_19935 [Micromonospora sp. NBC_00855]
MTLVDFISDLNEVSESQSLADVVAVAADRLSAEEISHESVVDELRRMTEDERQGMLCRSVDTTTHLKLSLDQNAHRALRLWLHVYKGWPPSEGRFAASIHDHRYAFVSKILRGGYVEQRWTIESDRVSPLRSAKRGVNSLNIVRAADVHSLVSVEPRTVSLVLQLPAERSFSRVYHPDRGAAFTSIPDLEAQYADFLAKDDR